MLVLSRKHGECVKVGDCWIRVEKKNGNIVMSFEAHKSIKVIRQEHATDADKQNSSLLRDERRSRGGRDPVRRLPNDRE